MPDRADLLAQAEQAVLTALQAIQALKATEVAPGFQIAPQPAPAPAVALPAHGLRAPAAFFDHMRASKILGPTLSQEEVTGCGAILDACADAAWPLAWTAYALGTSYHETAATMQPIHERGGNAYFRRMYDIEGERPAKARELGNTTPGDGAKYAGRGYVQLTGKTNYSKAGAKVGVDLKVNPDLAMQPDIAASILLWGMGTGAFTGKKLSDYLPIAGALGTSAQFKEARRIVNGQDRAADIAAYALVFQEALTKGQWS